LLPPAPAPNPAPGPSAITFLPLAALEEADLFCADDEDADDDALPFVAEADGLGRRDEDAEADEAATVDDFLFSGAVVFAKDDCLLLAADSVRGICCPPWLILLGFIVADDVLPAAPIEDFFGSMALGF